MNTYKLEAVLVLPFRGWLPGSQITWSGRCSNDDWDTDIALTHAKQFQVLGPPHYIDVSLFTIAEVRTWMAHNGDREEAKRWARNHASATMADRMIPIVNTVVLQLKRAYPKAILTGVLRSVGEIDLIYSVMNFDGENILCRSSPAVVACSGSLVPEFLLSRTEGAPGSEPAKSIPIYELASEWIAMTRAVDLVNHGYFQEALLVSFTLLDGLAQDFLKEHIPNLSKAEAATLMRAIESGRLRTFLGPMIRICLGESPLDQELNKKDLLWLNDKRNAIIHAGEVCTRGEAQRGVTIVWRFLRYLAEKGANYSLPSELEFWTPANSPIAANTQNPR